MKVTHYKPGDRVRLLKDIDGYEIKKGEIGTVSEPIIPKSLIPNGFVMVRFEGRDLIKFGKIRFTSTVCVRECDLVPADDPVKADGSAETSAVRHIIFDITNDGGEAKYIDGKNVVRRAKIRRSYEDEPNDFNAMMYLIGKLFPESEMSVKKVGLDECVEEDYPDVEGFARFQSPECGPLYIDINHITGIEYDRDKDGKKFVCIHTDDGCYDVKGYTVNEVMTKITEARCW